MEPGRVYTQCNDIAIISSVRNRKHFFCIKTEFLIYEHIHQILRTELVFDIPCVIIDILKQPLGKIHGFPAFIPIMRAFVQAFTKVGMAFPVMADNVQVFRQRDYLLVEAQLLDGQQGIYCVCDLSNGKTVYRIL